MTDAPYFQWDGEGASGGGLGFHQDAGLNMIALEFDTHQNDNSDLFPIDPGDTNWDNEIAADHIALNCNGQVDNLCPGTTVQAMPNMEDGLIHQVRIRYDAALNRLEVFWDGSLVYTANIDLETMFPSGAQWGWTAGTGSLNNETYVGWNGTTSPPCYATTCNPSSATTGACAPMPVELIWMKAKYLGGKVSIEWETATELLNKKFIIERISSQQKEWKAIGEIEGEGNSQELIRYSFLDTDPQYGLNYYRLKQVDFSGSFTYSQKVYINIESSLTKVYPNPFHEKLKFSSSEKILSIEIYNMLGKKVGIMGEEVNEADEINLNYLTEGNYVFKILNAEYQVQYIKVIKINSD
jgi:hypothetical protein